MKIRESILETTRKRIDQGNPHSHLNVFDLVSADAQYINMCMKKIFDAVRSTIGKKTGSNADEIEKAMLHIHQYIEKNSDECRFSPH